MIFIYYIIGGLLFGIGLAFWLVTTKLTESNNIGDTKGDRITYTHTFTITEAKDRVR